MVLHNPITVSTSPRLDPDASFVRLIAPNEQSGSIASTSLSKIEDVSPYVSVPYGEITVAAGDAATTVTVEKGNYYTVAVGADETASTLKDTIIGSPAKADLAFYNLTDLPDLALFVPAAKANVAEGIAPGNMSAMGLESTAHARL